MKTPRALRPCALLLAGCVFSGMLQAVIPSGLDVDTNRLDPADPGSQWTALIEGLRPDEPLQARFHEQRQNDFRRGFRNFRGILRLWPGHGASLHYTEPAEVTLVAKPGVLWRRPAGGEWTHYSAESGGQAAGLSEALWRLDLPALSGIYIVHGRIGDEADWELLLTPESDFRQPRVYLQGDDNALHRMEIEHDVRRRRTISFDEIDRSPPTEDWQDFFPGQK